MLLSDVRSDPWFSIQRLSTQRSPRTRWLTYCLLGSLVWPASCIDIGLPQIEVPVDLALFNGSGDFVLRGTAAIVNNDGPCPVWIADNGITYHLFQAPHLDNEMFDLVTSPGTTSRLVLAVRSDLVLTCQLGTVAEVRDVLEVVD